MLGKKIYPIILLAILMVAAPLTAATPNHINRLELTHENDFTVMTIYGQTAMKTVHQSVEAKEGKPFRIVVDCLPARHNLQVKNFTDLPSSVITNIRTSQYAINPEEVVRIVLDMAKTTIYRVDELDNMVKVYVSDPDTKSFAAWSSNDVIKDTPNKTDDKFALNEKQVLPPANPVKKTTLNEKEQLATTIKKDPVKTKNQNTIATINSKKKTNQPEITAKPTSNTNNTVAQAAVQTKTQPTTKTNAKPQPQYTVAKLPAPDKAVAYGPFQTVKPTPAAAQTPASAKQNNNQKASSQVLASADVKKSQPQDNPIPGRSPEMKVNEKHQQKPERSRSGASASSGTSSTPQPRPVTVAQVNDEQAGSAESIKDKKAAASRYRRENAKSLRQKQTQVVEFPKRIVIKYSSSGLRDPFKTMIDEELTGKGNFVHDRMPNIETLYLVGILKSGFGKSAALLEDIDGIGYILKPGDRVQNGYVSSITDDAVQFQINEYGWTRTVTRTMKSTESN